MTMNDSGRIDGRLEISRLSLKEKEVSVRCSTDIVDALFFHDPAAPLSNPTATLDHCIAAYWRILDIVAALFSSDEWKLITAFPLGYHTLCEHATARSCADNFDRHYTGNDWNPEVIGIRNLMPKFRRMTQAEYEAVKEITLILHNLGSAVAIPTLAVKLPSLARNRP